MCFSALWRAEKINQNSMGMEYLKYDTYRDSLAKKIKEKRIESKELAIDLLENEKKNTSEYSMAKTMRHVIRDIKNRKNAEQISEQNPNQVIESEQNIEKIVLNMTKCRDIARQLEERHEEQLFIDEEDSMISSDRNRSISINAVLRQFPEEIRNHYMGHGVIRSEALACSVSILENRVFFGFASSLVDSNYAAYTHAPFFILARKDKGISNGKVQIEIDGKIRGAAKLHPDVVFVCNLAFDSLVDDLRKMYPDAKILHATELVEYINEQEKETSEKQ